ncbi:MAG: hypothetical protein WDW38_010618 [Sanguina aurantia]
MLSSTRQLSAVLAAALRPTFVHACSGRSISNSCAASYAEAQLAQASSASSVSSPESVQASSSSSAATPARWLAELGVIRVDWTRAEVAEVFNTPLLDLVHHASTVHRMYNDPQMAAVRARDAGSTRFCMGAAWRGPSQVGNRQWERVLEMVGKVRGLGMEVCTTLGMLNSEQAAQLREAGLTAYNHNLDTSPEYYGKITTSRKYEDRLETLKNVRDAGISVCAGGIIGLGEGLMDRVGLLHQLASLPAHPESVPINRLVAIKGTPLEAQAAPEGVDLVRCIATARVIMPRTVVRLSAGRLNLSLGDQALCFLAGANSIFDGDKLLTTANNDRNEDLAMFETLGLRSRPAFLPYASGEDSSRSFASATA